MVGLLPFWLLVYQHILLPFAGFFVGAMYASHPTAGALLTVEKLLYSAPDPPCTSLILFCIFNPANEFISGN
jgi:hypothetical protein